ncbi:hypothetical protein D3C85_1262130 [compost metagenome]
MLVVDEGVLPQRAGFRDECCRNLGIQVPVAVLGIEGATVAGLEGASGQQLIPTILGRLQVSGEDGDTGRGQSGSCQRCNGVEWCFHAAMMAGAVEGAGLSQVTP